MSVRIWIAAFAAMFVLSASGSAVAAVIVPSTAVGNSQYSGYPATNAFDIGAAKYLTDWAANSTGNGSYLNIDLGAVYALANALLTDRTTSGGNNGTFAGGTTDFTTQFSIQSYTDGTFATTSGAALTFTKVAPSSPTTTAQFLYTALLGGMQAEFIRYTVVTANGPNPGLADIEFTTVPEPSSLALLSLGIAILYGVRRRIRSPIGN